MKTSDISIRQLILSARKTLETAGIEEVELNADYLAAHLLKTERGKLPLHWHDIADNGFIATYAKLIDRRSKREPLQYILESWDFLDLSLKTAPGALIPRADTESLVLAVIEQVKAINLQVLTFVDVCTGSGAIGLALAKQWPTSNCILLDVCPKATYLARLNARRNSLGTIAVLQANMLAAIKPESVDLVVSNPPYIPTGDICDLMPEVKDYEPHLALDGGSNGFDFIKTLISQSFNILRPGGILAFEHGWNQQKTAVELLDDSWQLLQTGQDLCHNDRFLICAKT